MCMWHNGSWKQATGSKSFGSHSVVFLRAEVHRRTLRCCYTGRGFKQNHRGANDTRPTGETGSPFRWPPAVITNQADFHFIYLIFTLCEKQKDESDREFRPLLTPLMPPAARGCARLISPRGTRDPVWKPECAWAARQMKRRGSGSTQAPWCGTGAREKRWTKHLPLGVILLFTVQHWLKLMH